jgi:MurNAc alpha-1-phosphate uridylyltransferase
MKGIKAMILAAGRGERMRPLTDACPKPMLKVADKPLLVYHIERLVAAGINEIVINHAWLGEQIEQAIGDGAQWGARVRFSPEPEGGLETAGGIIKALPLLGDKPFVVVNGDIWTDFDFSQLRSDFTGLGHLAHLVLVENPAHNPQGDFVFGAGTGVDASARLLNEGEKCYTFAGIGVYDAALFTGLDDGLSVQKRPLTPLLRQAIEQQQVTGQLFNGRWTDVGTPVRLAQLALELEQALQQ